MLPGAPEAGPAAALAVEAMPDTLARIASVPNPFGCPRQRVRPAGPVEAAARWLSERLARVLGPSYGEPGAPAAAAIAVGAQGCEDAAHCAELAAALERRLRVRTVVVNDAELLLPAAGVDRGVALIAGTGSIAVWTDGAGHTVRAGGRGWVLSDDGTPRRWYGTPRGRCSPPTTAAIRRGRSPSCCSPRSRCPPSPSWPA